MKIPLGVEMENRDAPGGDELGKLRVGEKAQVETLRKAGSVLCEPEIVVPPPSEIFVPFAAVGPVFFGCDENVDLPAAESCIDGEEGDTAGEEEEQGASRGVMTAPAEYESDGSKGC